MNQRSLESIFQKISLGLVLFLSSITALAIHGYFRKDLVVSSVLIIGLFWFVVILVKLIKKGIKLDKYDLGVMVVILVIVLLNGVFYHDLPQGRDNMGYLTAAVKITESQSLSFQDIISRPYHPFRNLGDDVFTSQFLPGYNSWLAVFYLFGGLEGLFWANALLLFFLLLAFYFIGKKILNQRAGLLSVLLIVTLYTTIWFTRRTLAENLFMFLIWCGVWFLITAFKDKKSSYLAGGLFFLSLSPLVRTEGLIYLFLYFLVLIFLLIKYFRKDFKAWGWSALFTILSLFNLYLFKIYGERYGDVYIQYAYRAARSFLNFVFSSNLFFYGILSLGVLVILYLVYKKFSLQIKKNFNFRYLILTLILLTFISWEIYNLIWLNRGQEFRWAQYKIQYVIENFAFYLLIPYILVAYWGLYKKVYSKVVFYILIVISPTFVFLIEPNVAVDQPWFMRRFFPVFIPFVVLLASLTLTRLVKLRGSFFKLALIFLIINVSLSWPILTFREYEGVQPQLKQLATNFDEEDLVIMDPGWHWQQWGYALHYIYKLDVLPNLDGFSQEDFVGLLKDYKNIYVMSDKKSSIHQNFGDENLIKVFDWHFNYKFLKRTSWIASYIDENKDALDLKVIRDNQKGTPPREFEIFDQTFYIYKVIDRNLVVWPTLRIKDIDT